MTSRSFATPLMSRDASSLELPASRSLTPAVFARGVASPRVWVLSSPRAGERTQLLALAEALGCPFEVKRIVHRRLGGVVSLVSGEHLVGVDRRRSDALDGPWPDLVLLAHQSNENVARWIRRQSGGKTRLVLIGRPWASADAFDLVVTTPQYDLPEGANILHNALPLHLVAPDRLSSAATKWQPRLAHLPRPFITVLVGGSSGPYVFDAAAAARLGREASALAQSLGGSVLVTTSARTPKASVDALFAAIDAPACLHRWAPGDSENPYFGFVALADRLIVTADSISMLAEACATGKPVQMFAFDAGALRMRKDGGKAHAGVSVRSRIRGGLYAAYSRLPRGRLNRSRDLRIVHRSLLATGRVSWLGDRTPAVPMRQVGDEMTRTVNRLRGLMHGQSAGRMGAQADVASGELGELAVASA